MVNGETEWESGARSLALPPPPCQGAPGDQTVPAPLPPWLASKWPGEWEPAVAGGEDALYFVSRGLRGRKPTGPPPIILLINASVSFPVTKGVCVAIRGTYSHVRILMRSRFLVAALRGPFLPPRGWV